jgi:peptide chain release factor subunit 1
MFSREELREIAKAGENGAGFVSLYLNVNPVTNPGGEYAIWVKNAIKEYRDAADPGTLKLVEPDLKAIEGYIQANRRDFKKGLAVLSSKEKSFWREYNLLVPVKNELVVDTAPYIKPLLDILERYKRYAVLIVDKETARIFVIHLGEITEYGEVHTEDVPGKHKKGGWFSLAQNHYDRHISHHVGLHLKDVIKRFEPFIAGEDINRLVLGGSEEAVLRTKSMLPKTVQSKIIGTFQAGLYEGTLDVLKRAEPVLREYENQIESDTVGDIIQKAMKKERAVVGLEAVLRALQEARVQKLVLERDAAAMGLQCTACGALTEQEAAETCPYCGGRMEKVNHLMDLAVQKAVEQSAEVFIVPESQELRKVGSIGAMLRF